MAHIDLAKLDSLPPELRQQAEMLLEQFPQLRKDKIEKKVETTTPITPKVDEQTIDYSSFNPQETLPPPASKPHVAEIKIDPKLSSFGPEEKEEAAVEEQKPRQKNEFSPVGKVHPVLAKMRATLGMTTQTAEYVAEIGGVHYTLVALDNFLATKALVLAASNSTSEIEYKINSELAGISYACTHIDHIPLETVFSIADKMNDHTLTPTERQDLAASEMYRFLKGSPPQFSDLLLQFHKQEFPAINLLSKNTDIAYCPAENCQYSRIIEKEAKLYCPYHGEILVEEGVLPNPS